MKILIVTQLFPYNKEDKNTSGAIREFAEEWGKMGHNVKVLRPHFSYEKEPFPYPSNLKISNNIDVDFIRPKRIPLLKYSWFSRKKTLKLITFSPDVVICHLYNAYFSFSWLAEKFKVPLIIGIHMSDIRISKNIFHRWHQKQIFKKANAFACRSYSYERLFHLQFPEFKEKTFVAISGIPDKYLNLKTKSTEIKEIRIITVSSLIKRKQIDKVLKALASIHFEIDWEYKIIGSGVEIQKLQKLTYDLGITEKVNFCGQYPRDKVIDELLKSDIFVLPSYNETLGLVYLEALACGCITIGSKNEGIDGIIVNGKNGFLCDSLKQESINMVIEKAIYMDKDTKDKILQNAKKTISLFSLKNKAKEYLNRINNV